MSTWFEDMLEEKFCDFYIVSTEESSIAGLVKAMGLEKESFAGFYEFLDDFYWDQMIVRDEDYFWAEWVSEEDPFGLYGAYI